MKARFSFIWAEETSDWTHVTLSRVELQKVIQIEENEIIVYTSSSISRVLLLIVSLAVEGFVAEEAGVFQRLATWCAVQAALVPQSVLHAEQVPVPDELITAFTHALSPHVWKKDTFMIHNRSVISCDFIYTKTCLVCRFNNILF